SRPVTRKGAARTLPSLHPADCGRLTGNSEVIHKPDKSATRKLRLFWCKDTVEGWRSWIADAIKDALSRFRGLLCCQGAADLGVARLDCGVDQVDTPVIRQEGALH